MRLHFEGHLRVNSSCCFGAKATPCILATRLTVNCVVEELGGEMSDEADVPTICQVLRFYLGFMSRKIEYNVYCSC